MKETKQTDSRLTQANFMPSVAAGMRCPPHPHSPVSATSILAPQLVAMFGEAQEAWPCWRTCAAGG